MADPFPPTTDPAVADLQQKVIDLQAQSSALLKELRVNLRAIRSQVPYNVYRSAELKPILDQVTDEKSVLS